MQHGAVSTLNPNKEMKSTMCIMSYKDIDQIFTKEKIDPVLGHKAVNESVCIYPERSKFSAYTPRYILVFEGRRLCGYSSDNKIYFTVGYYDHDLALLSAIGLYTPFKAYPYNTGTAIPLFHHFNILVLRSGIQVPLLSYRAYSLNRGDTLDTFLTPKLIRKELELKTVVDAVYTFSRILTEDFTNRKLSTERWLSDLRDTCVGIPYSTGTSRTLTRSKLLRMCLHPSKKDDYFRSVVVIAAMMSSIGPTTDLLIYDKKYPEYLWLDEPPTNPTKKVLWLTHRLKHKNYSNEIHPEDIQKYILKYVLSSLNLICS